jgi:uncharacterized membrane protein YqjE
MSVPESAGSGTSPGLFTSLRSFWAVLVAILYTRLDLLTVELEEEANRAFQLLVVCAAGLFCLGMAIFFLMFFLIVVFWDERVLVIGLITSVSIVGSVTFLLIARHLFLTRPAFLSQTLAELRRDAESLRPRPFEKTEETQS